MKKEFVCIECPRGCALTVEIEKEKVSVSGNFCPRGEKYAKAEVVDPKRVLTSSVRSGNGLTAVKTDKEIKKTAIFDLMKIIRNFKSDKTYKIGDIVIENIDGEGANLVATSE